MKRIYFLIFLFAPLNLVAQETPDKQKLSFTGDFRFRVEHDWNSQRPDGTFRDDRSRLRYRLRFGFYYQVSPHAGFGARVRTGRLDDQQGPHLTLGGNNGEFSIIELGFEKVYFQWKRDWFQGWVGKNSFPFHKLNELFWNNNVFPEGISMQFNLPTLSQNLSDLQLRVGHFVVGSLGAGFGADRFMEGIQLHGKTLGKKLTFFPGFYYFNKMANIPDNQGTFDINYAIAHIGAAFEIAQKPRIWVGYEYYQNLQNLSLNDSIPEERADQKRGNVVTLRLGELKEKGQWQFTLYLAHIEQYAIVDYFAQNDWARWDYSSFGAAGARSSNFKGFEFRLGYAFEPGTNLVLRLYSVEQLQAKSTHKETGSRVRLDLNVGF